LKISLHKKKSDPSCRKSNDIYEYDFWYLPVISDIDEHDYWYAA